MTEEQIFLAALDQPDAAARMAYLDEACGADAALRGQVEALIVSHFRSGEFLDVPAAEQIKPVSSTAPTVTMKENAVSGERDDESDELRFLSPSARPDSLGRIGHYEVLQVLGKGGFGIVLRAFDEILQRVVAVKVMASQLAATSPARKRFLREARTSAAVRHGNVVQVYEVGEQPLPYLVMEFIPGETLQQKLDRSGPLEVSEVVRIGRQIAEGLAAAHANDLIHRDIKPGNVLIEGGQNRVKITDFGLARAADDASISQSGIIAGTPMYMAPEQAKGEKLDQRADLFSLGSVLYQMASGRAPFRANNTVAVLKRVAEDTPRDIREIIPETPQWLCDIIAKLHAKNPDERYQSAREVADVLADCEAKLKANVDPMGFPMPVQTKLAPRRWSEAAIIVSVVALASLGLLLGKYLGEGTPAPLAVTPQNQLDQPPYLGKEPRDFGGNPKDWVQLFNGKDKSGWKTHPEQPGTWEVKDGILIGSTQHSHLFSERADFENFHLRAEVKLNSGGDTGIRFRTPFRMLRGKEAWQVIPFGGYEAEITKLPAATAQTGSVWRGRVNLDGPPYTLFRSADPSFPRADEWCIYEVIAEGNHFITKLNGKVIADCTDPVNAYSSGHIALQCFSAQTYVQFRKIEIKDLPPNPPAVSLADPAILQTLRDVRSAKERSLAAERTRFEAGLLNRLQVIPFEIDVLEARIGLAEAERDKPAVAGHLEALVKLRQEECDQIATRIEAGILPTKEIHDAEVRLAQAKARLAQVMPLPPTFKNNLGMEFVRVPKGKAWLGGVANKPGDKVVEIPADFYLGKYEVTQEEWEKVVGENPSHFSRKGEGKDAVKDISDADLKRFPVENVSWDQCQLFVAKLNKLEKETGWVYRLPKETEWEYACRGGPMADKVDGAYFHYFEKPTNTLLLKQANFSPDIEGKGGLGRTCKVGSYEANRLGLHDMQGNVWELCENVVMRPGGSLRVSRGGSWFNDSGICRAGGWLTGSPAMHNSRVGLRLARVPSDSK